MITVAFERYCGSYTSDPPDEILASFGWKSSKRRPSRVTESSMKTFSLAVQGKNMQSILLPSGPFSITCLPSKVSVRICLAWSNLPNIKSSTRQQQRFFTLALMPFFNSSVSSSKLSMFSWLDSFFMTRGMARWAKNLFTFVYSIA